MSFHALLLAIGDLFRPRVFRVVIWGVLLTILLFFVLQAGVFYAIRIFAPETVTLPWIGPIAIGGALSWGSLALLPVMGFFLMAPVAAAFSGIFADQVAEAVETDHYPQNIGQPVDMWDGILDGFAIMLAVIAVGLVTLILSPFLGPLAPVLFYGANGWLLGREFFQMAARRHLLPEAATELRKRRAGFATALGVMIALLLTVPVLNIVIPTLAAAGFTHLYHLNRRSAEDPRG